MAQQQEQTTLLAKSSALSLRTTTTRLLILTKRNPTMMAGIVIVLIMMILALLAPLLNTIDPKEIDPRNRFLTPSMDTWFGSDNVGRDVYSRTIYGTRVSLIVGFAVAVISTFSAAMVGVVLRLLPQVRRGDHAGDGRAHVHSVRTAGHGPDGPLRGKRTERHHRPMCGGVTQSHTHRQIVGA